MHCARIPWNQLFHKWIWFHEISMIKSSNKDVIVILMFLIPNSPTVVDFRTSCVFANQGHKAMAFTPCFLHGPSLPLWANPLVRATVPNLAMVYPDSSAHGKHINQIRTHRNIVSCCYKSQIRFYRSPNGASNLIRKYVEKWLPIFRPPSRRPVMTPKIINE